MTSRSLEFLATALAAAWCAHAASPIKPDANTVILEHFDGSTSGTPAGNPVYNPGLSGLNQAIGLSAGSWVKFALPASLQTQGTIEMWINPSAYGGGIMNFNWSNTDSPPSSGHVLHLYLTSQGNIEIGGWAWSPSCMSTLTSSTPLALGKWSHIALTWSSTSVKIYINGSVNASANQCWNPASPAWGYLNYWGGSELGSVDEMQISDIQRTDEEIAAHAAHAVSPLTTIRRNYTGSVDLHCPAGYSAIVASCNAGVGVILNGLAPAPPGGAWRSYLTPSVTAATGVHCDLGSPSLQSQALLRCLK